MERALNEQIGPRVAGRYVLAIQDASAINYQAQSAAPGVWAVSATAATVGCSFIPSWR